MLIKIASLLVLAAMVLCSAQASPSLVSGSVNLTIASNPSKNYGLCLRLAGQEICRQNAPLAAEVVTQQGVLAWVIGGYSRVAHLGKGLVCTGTLTSVGGTTFQFTDTYQPAGAPGAFMVSRRVVVKKAGAQDIGFSSRFSLIASQPNTTHDCDFFVPGLWYKDNAHVPATALASHLNDRFFYFREDRLPLPLTMQRNKHDGVALALLHVGGNPTTFVGEDGLKRIIDARMQFGSLGVVNTGHLETAFLFPGTEGERTYTYGSFSEDNRWAYRSHPVIKGFTQQYRLIFQVSRTTDFPAALRRTWRLAYACARPRLVKADLGKVYRDSMALLSKYCQKYRGVICMPFEATVPQGIPYDISSQMGFVGQSLPCAADLLRYSFETKDADVIRRASALVDFWAKYSPMSSGLPKTWYNVRPDGQVVWRSDPVYLRITSDGMDGALQAWNVMHQHGQNRPAWLAFCRRYGDWLVRTQNADGSFPRGFSVQGKVLDGRKDTTDQPIKFLVDLFKVTGDARYRQAALKAGVFCWRTVHLAYAYVGGAPDNPDVMDKESGMIALDAFLALFDLTGDRKWVMAAAQAAWYSETWVYLWNIPMPREADPKIVFPRNRTTVGLSLIASGHSGADNYMAAAPFLFYRIYLLTGETHFRDSACLLMQDTKQMMDWDGTLGYRYPGLLTEALSLPPLRGHGVNGWLPWLTVAILEPMIRLRDVFGSADITVIDHLPLTERRRRNGAFSRTRGFDMPRISESAQTGLVPLLLRLESPTLSSSAWPSLVLPPVWAS